MNRDITRYTYNVLFDENMGDPVHLASGGAYGRTVPGDGDRNDRAVHQDVIVDGSEHSTIAVDGDVLYGEGRFGSEGAFDTR